MPYFSLRHIHKRKRKHQKEHEPYPSERKGIRFLDRLMFVIAIAGPFANLPQVLRVFMRHSAGDISSFSYFFFTLFNIPWICYGIVHKDKPITIAYILWFITNLSILIGSLIY